ncbi:MAG: Na+/H+ antiporter subunit E [Wenzhouxiangellaceae bacterium]
MRYAISLGLVLAVLWLALSGVYKPLMFGLGAASVLFVVWVAMRMEVIGVEHNPVLYSWRLPVYWLWLLREVIVANLQVARAVIDPRRIDPQVLHLPLALNSAIAKVTYANSITLTPGTVTLRLEKGHVEVHALTREAVDGLRSGQMERMVAWLESSR